MSQPLIDIGANLTHASFDTDRPQVIARARAAGVQWMIVTGSDAQASQAARELCRQYPGTLFATAGVHPHHAKDVTDAAWPRLRDLLGYDEVVAVGECGLDYFRNFSPPAAQRVIFELQLQLAVDAGKPVFLHQRDAHADFMAILRKYRHRLRTAAVHCFTGSETELRDYLALDCHIGITGWICDERRGSHLRNLVKQIPAERLLIETDAPYLLPRDLQPKPRTRRNEPMYLAHICATVAACTDRPVTQVAAETTLNASRCFDLPALASVE